MRKKQIKRFYNSFQDDFTESKNQNYTLPKNYCWLKLGFFYRITSAALYAIAFIISKVYCKFFLHVRIINKSILKNTNGKGAFIYGNHTQPIGDVFNPAHAVFPKRINTIASPANLGIPFLGKILPSLAALPVPNTISAMKEFNAAIEYRYSKGRYIIVYPEAHVWEYYTGIRPFDNTSFRYPAKLDAPVFTMTTTYKLHKHRKKPDIDIYIDGPIYTPENIGTREKCQYLHDKVYAKLSERAKLSDTNYIEYIKK